MIVALILGLVIAFRSHWAVGLTAAALLILYAVYVNQSAILVQMGNIAYMRGDQEKALALLEKASRMRRVQPKHLTGYAYLLLKAGDPAKAEQLERLQKQTGAAFAY
jgi:Flp pilus assembly protein TadD